VSGVLVFDWHSPGASALAAELEQRGIPAWPASNPLVAAELVAENDQIGGAVVECTLLTLPLCQQLRARRPDLAIIGIQADGRMAPRNGCEVGCDLISVNELTTLAPLLQSRLA
jgi:hypothetical protein